jgi:hypothetical protein
MKTRRGIGIRKDPPEMIVRRRMSRVEDDVAAALTFVTVEFTPPAISNRFDLRLTTAGLR